MSGAELVREEMIQKVSKVRSGCLVAAWAIETLKMEVNPPEGEELKFELQEGLGFLLESMAGELGTVQERLMEEKSPL